jgi:D-alanine-D-alanine ligase
MLEMLRIPYTGSDPVTLAICLDKARTKEVLAYHKVPTPKMQVMDTPDAKLEGLKFPVIVKPLQEGSSKGIVNDSVVRDNAALKKQLRRVMGLYRQPAIVEEYLPGREFTVALIGNGSKLDVLPIVEIKFDTLPGKANPIYSFEAKWVWDVPEAPLDIFECPAKVPNGLKREIEEVCRRAFDVLNCTDWCRIDVRLDARGRANVLELNPLPGILPKPEDNSCFPKAARAAGMTYSQLINRVLDAACERHGLGGVRKSAGARKARSAVVQNIGFAK